MPILKNNAPDRVQIPEAMYPATLSGCREMEIDDHDNPGAKKTILVWAFEIISKKGNVATLEAMSSLAFSSKSKARPWVKALLGGAEPDASGVDTDELIGLPCRVVVEDKTKDGATWSIVTDVKMPAVEGEEGF
jgi:hypothetical protein